MNKSEVEILLVEDSEADLELDLHFLRAENLANCIHVTRDGEQALRFLSQCVSDQSKGESVLPRLILLDLKLPKLDGIDVLRRIKGAPDTKMIPVFVLTSSAEGQELVNSYQLGVSSYIQKPIEFEKFRKRMRDLSQYWLIVNQVPVALKGSQVARGRN